MSALLTVPELGLGRAMSCNGALTHNPRPLRFVWHHVLPQTCGGLTALDNMVELCDNCHYAAHAYMYCIAVGLPLPTVSRGVRVIALRGYSEARRLKVLDKIPNEGYAGAA